MVASSPFPSGNKASTCNVWLHKKKNTPSHPRRNWSYWLFGHRLMGLVLKPMMTWGSHILRNPNLCMYIYIYVYIYTWERERDRSVQRPWSPPCVQTIFLSCQRFRKTASSGGSSTHARRPPKQAGSKAHRWAIYCSIHSYIYIYIFIFLFIHLFI
jgi:hypothetical protein